MRLRALPGTLVEARRSTSTTRCLICDPGAAASRRRMAERGVGVRVLGPRARRAPRRACGSWRPSPTSRDAVAAAVRAAAGRDRSAVRRAGDRRAPRRTLTAVGRRGSRDDARRARGIGRGVP